MSIEIGMTSVLLTILVFAAWFLIGFLSQVAAFYLRKKDLSLENLVFGSAFGVYTLLFWLVWGMWASLGCLDENPYTYNPTVFNFSKKGKDR